MTDKRIKVLVADDSSVTRLLLVHLLESDPRIRVIGEVIDGQAAVEFVNETKPDVVLMDIHMPRMDGFEATRRIMETRPVPIIICSATADTKEIATAIHMLESGAVACLEKPVGPSNPKYETLVTTLLETVKLMSEVKVIRHWPRSKRTPVPAPTPASHQSMLKPATVDIKIVGIGASTGGPVVLQSILAGLPKNFPVPILIVQHIAKGFVSGLMEWLKQTTDYAVELGAHNITPLPGRAYLAPDDVHMGIGSSGAIILSKDDPENHLRPAVSFLFRSLVESYGHSALGVLLTGMGRDGANELKAMKDCGSITLAQDHESSVVHGMPGAAIALGGVTHVLAANKIADALVALVNGRNEKSRY